MKHSIAVSLLLFLILSASPSLAQEDTASSPASAAEEPIEKALESEAEPEASEAIPDAEPVEDTYDFVLMEPRAEVVFITTGGAEVRADWTETAANNLKSSFRSQIEGQGYSLVDFDEEAERSEDLEQLLLLYEVVSASSNLNMPHKGKGQRNNTGLTLGENTILLKQAYNSDKAMFVDHYSSITSSGVFLTSVLIGAATGYVPVVPTVRATSGHVVDLENGEIMASNIAMLGDAREQGEASNIVTRVMKKLPLQ